MSIYIGFENEKFKYVRDKNGNKTIFKVGTLGRIYNTKTKEFIQPNISSRWNSSWTKKKRKAPILKARRIVTLYQNKKLIFQGSVARLILMTFKPLKDYTNMEADHINENPLDDSLDNLQWLTSEENKIKAAKARNRNYTVYDDEIIHLICQALCDNISRKKIKEKYHVRGQLIDDIKSGRSHRNISSLYIDKGFKYREFNKEERKERQKKVENICKLIDKGFTNAEIASLMNLPNNEICLPNDIRKLRIYKYISQDFNFYKESNQENKKVIYDKKVN